MVICGVSAPAHGLCLKMAEDAIDTIFDIGADLAQMALDMLIHCYGFRVEGEGKGKIKKKWER